MKKTSVIRLGVQQASIINDILREQYSFYPKKASKFSLKETADGHVLYCDGKLDTEFFGQIMYILGMKMKY